jgi:ADP-L-glycero-D-manno-heptose 6-epimerase
VGLSFEDYRDRDDFLFDLMGNRLEEGEAVFHLGACSCTTEKDSGYLAENNYRYSRLLCQWCLDKKIRFITASSAATYGDGALGYSDDDEVTPSLKPLNMYGYSKQMFDLWALKHNLYQRIAGLKYFNVFGPHEAHKGEMRSVVHKAFGQIRALGEVNLFKSCSPEYKDGEQVRDFIYVKDAVEMTLFFLDHPEISGLFNCGTGKARTWNDLVTAVFSAMGREPKIHFIDLPENLKKTYQYFTQAEMTKMRNAGYDKPFTSLEEGVRDYVQNHLMH